MKALITGIRGQDGTYLARELSENGRRVFGWTRQQADQELPMTNGDVFPVDYSDVPRLTVLLEEIRPAEIYHLASPSCIRDTPEFERDIFFASVDLTRFFLRWIAGHSPETRFFLAGSSEIFGDPGASPQNEDTLCRPENPYGMAKLAGRQLCAAFREKERIFASTGILYNHESPMRRADFVSRRITQGVAAIVAGKSKTLALGNLEARRDWSHAADFTRAFRLILETNEPGDFVLASGCARRVRDFCEVAFAQAGLDYRDHVVVDATHHRPDFKHPRLGDTARAQKVLGWEPKVEFTEMVAEMVRHDLDSQKSADGR
jgi:GDPmannose 4,6-dehydratase